MQSMGLQSLVVAFALLAVLGEGNNSGVSNPITKVVELIKELRGKITADGKAEELIYNKMACWCESTTHAKADEIADAQDELSRLSQAVSGNKGTISTRASSISELMSEISVNEAKQYEDTTKRERQNADYMQNKAELTNAIAALDKAVQMLSGIDHLSLLQGKFSSQQAATLVRAKDVAMKVVERLPADSIPMTQLSALERMGSVTVASGGAAYKPFEPTVTSILKDLLESFRATQETETTNEVDLQKSYDEIMQVKGSELTTKKAQVKVKEEDKAAAATYQAQNEAEWQKTAKQLTAANNLFVAMKPVCTAKADTYNARVNERNDELAGIDDALETLTSDENRATIGSASADGPTGLHFLQVGITHGSTKSNLYRAYVAFNRAAKQAKSLRLSKLASRLLAQLKVKEPADATDSNWQADVIRSSQMIVDELDSEQVTDTETLDNCRDEEQRLQLIIDNRTHIIKRHNLKLAQLESKVETLDTQIEKASADVHEIEEMQVAMKAEREGETEEFDREKANDEAAITILESAIADLGKYYKNSGIELGPHGNDAAASLLAEQHATVLAQWELHHKLAEKQGFLQKSSKPEFEVTDTDMLKAVDGQSFSGTDKRAGASKGIISLLMIIKDDLASDISKSVKIENKSEKDYVEMRADSNQEITDLKDKITDYESDKGDRNDDISDHEGWKETEQTDLDSKLDEMNTMMGAGDEGKDISFACTFMYENYTNRRHRREAEADGLKEGIAFLNGMTA